MAATTNDVTQLRRMVAEASMATYSDEVLESLIEAHPLTDSAGYEPLLEDGTVNEEWTATYDLHAAAAEIWQEKAASLADKFDFDTGDGNFRASQMHKQAMEQARFHLSRRSARMVRLQPQPKSEE